MDNEQPIEKHRRISEASLANLKPFPPGVSGNPKGRPPKQDLNDRVLELLESERIGGKPIPGERKRVDLILEAVFREAIKGKLPHAKELLDRGYGTVPVKQEHSGPDGGPIEHTHEIPEEFQERIGKAYSRNGESNGTTH